MKIAVYLVHIAMFWLCTTASADPWNLEQAAAGIYVHHGVHEDMSEGYHGDICNISFVIGSKGIAVIDTGGNAQVGQQLLAHIRQISHLPILYVINTHVHPDHIFGNAAFLPEHPIFVGHAKLPDAMERRQEQYLRINQEWQGSEFAGSSIIKPSLLVSDSTQLDLGGRVLTLTAYPTAHTNTDITVMDSSTQTLWTGDLLFAERTPSIDGDIKAWINIISQLKSAQAKQIIPGHGPVLSDWQAALDKQQLYLNTLLNDVRDSIKHGEMMESAMQSAAKSQKQQWQLFEIINPRNVNLIYPALEWE
jgi:quinoprotein relay system zinc metallohydrolase 2